MQRLLKIAQLATMTQFTHDHAHSTSQQEELYEHAAAAANYLFGNSAMPVQGQRDLAAEQPNTQEWLKRNQKIRELVVQSLRVANVIGWSEAGVCPEIGTQLLQEFGTEFPTSPQLDSYRALVRQVVVALPPSDVRPKLIAALES